MVKTPWVVAAVALLLAGCGGGPQSDTGSPSSAAPPQDPADTVEIVGDSADPVNQLAITAIADLEEYWSQEFPALYGEEYRPISGGFYAVVPSSDGPPPCAQTADEVAGNAYYCGGEDVVAWDAEGLLPDLQARFGDFVIPVVMAHEWAHAVQARSNFTARTVTKELQADCFAGAWSRHARQDGVFEVTDGQMDAALAGILDLRDAPGTAAVDPNAHGTGFDRVSAFQDGFDNGNEACKAYRDDEPMVLALPFTDLADLASGGNMPYDSVLNSVPYDLEDYWSQVFPELTAGEPWIPVAGLVPFDPAAPPACGGTPADGYSLFYCVPDDYVGWDNVGDMPRVYEQGGDYAVATLLATQYGLAAMTRAGDESDALTQSLRGDCFAGAYTASVVIGNRSGTSTYQISPGDLDEAITALLVFRGDGDVDRQGSGFDRIRAFRNGVIDGAPACLEEG